MKINKLCSLIAKREGKKHQATIGDVREIVGIVSDVIWTSTDTLAELLANGKRRAKK